MTRYRYSYKTRITFSESIFSHHYLLRCIPFISENQKIIENSCRIAPDNNQSWSYDSFNNTVITGYIGDFHDFFEFQSDGVIDLYRNIQLEALNPLFLYHSKLTQSSAEIQEICNIIKARNATSVHEQIFNISNEITSRLTYSTGATNVYTTAAESIKLGRGVCQDFSHLMISICRELGIAARYVTGFMEGEGFTHAWIEYYSRDRWYGFDPTHNQTAEPGYIKLAHGRDYADCPIDKGVFKGLTNQHMEISLKVERI